MEDTNALTEELSKEFGRTPRHYMDQLFHHGARVKVTPKVSSYHAWLSHKAREVNAGINIMFLSYFTACLMPLLDSMPGQAVPMLEVQQTYGSKYYDLDDEELARLVHEHSKDLESRTYGLRVNTNARIHDVKTTMSTIEKMVSHLVDRFAISAYPFVSVGSLKCPGWH